MGFLIWAMEPVYWNRSMDPDFHCLKGRHPEAARFEGLAGSRFAGYRWRAPENSVEQALSDPFFMIVYGMGGIL